MELKTRLNGKGSNDQVEGSFVKGCFEKSSKSRGRSSDRDSSQGKEDQEADRNTSLRRKFKCYNCKKYGYYKVEYLKLKTKEEDD